MKHDIIYIDPPWHYNSRKSWWEMKDKTKFWWGAEKHYPLMKDKELIEFKETIDEYSNDNCMMFMWVTMPKLDFWIELMKSWWFKYKTVAFTWVKTNKDWTYRFNPWYYTASNVELCIIWIKWKNWWLFKPAKAMLNQIVAEPLREHSRKPDIVRENIEIMYPKHSKVEIFARTQTKWWWVFWNQINKFRNNLI